MTIDTPALVEEEIVGVADKEGPLLQWTPVVAGALSAAAFSLILAIFGIGIGLGVSSTSPSWRDASAALALLSGIYLILQAVLSFGLGGYLAGRIKAPSDAPLTEEVERWDGVHGLAAWALAVLLGAALTAAVGAITVSRALPAASAPNATAAEPLLSYELDKLFRSARRPANVDMNSGRAEAGRILMTSSSHNGVSGEDRTYLVQQVAASTGLSPGDAEKRVDQAITDSKTAIARSRRSTIILAFSLAAATLLGAVVAWSAAVAGGRHRDGAPLPYWMAHASSSRRRSGAAF
jgi:hypothetical protein